MKNAAYYFLGLSTGLLSCAVLFSNVATNYIAVVDERQRVMSVMQKFLIEEFEKKHKSASEQEGQKS